MQDRNRPTLRLRLPVTPPGEARRPAAAPPPLGPLSRPAVYVAPPRMGTVPLDACSRAIIQELAALGLAEPEEG